MARSVFARLVQNVSVLYLFIVPAISMRLLAKNNAPAPSSCC